MGRNSLSSSYLLYLSRLPVWYGKSCHLSSWLRCSCVSPFISRSFLLSHSSCSMSLTSLVAFFFQSQSYSIFKKKINCSLNFLSSRALPLPSLLHSWSCQVLKCGQPPSSSLIHLYLPLKLVFILFATELFLLIHKLLLAKSIGYFLMTFLLPLIVPGTWFGLCSLHRLLLLSLFWLCLWGFTPYLDSPWVPVVCDDLLLMNRIWQKWGNVSSAIRL